jgi:predicted nucleotidyltransferase
MSDSQALVQLLSATLQSSPRGVGLHVVLLFGSAARGELRADSDLDVGILPVDPNQPLAAELALQSDLERATKRRVDLVRLDRADLLVRWEAARTGMLVFEDGAGRAAHFRAETALEHADMAPLIEAGAERWRRAVAARAGARK